MSELIDCISGYAYSSSELVQKSTTALTTIKNFGRNGGFKDSGFKAMAPCKNPKPNQYLEVFDLIVAHTDLTQAADIIGNAEIVLTKGSYEKLVMSSDLVKVVPKSDLGVFIISSIFKQNNFKEYAIGYSSGTTVLHLNKKCIPDYLVRLPVNLSDTKQIDNELSLYYKQIALHIEENQILTQVRNELLSTLMVK